MRCQTEGRLKAEKGKIIVPGTIYSRAGRGFRGDPSNMKQTKNEKFFSVARLGFTLPWMAGKQRLKYNVAMARRESAGNFRDSGLLKVVRSDAARDNENARK